MVFRAHDNNMNIDVALKLFTRGSPPRLAYTEAQLLTRLEGPHILRVYNADVADDIPYVASAIALAGTAEDAAKVSPVPVQQALQWIAHLLHGLDACHRLELVHRDIKPSNLFLDSPEAARLGDFGTASLLRDGSVTAAGDPRIRAPEMWVTGFGDTRADLYSIGATFWYLLVGEFPIPIAEATPSEDYAKLVLAGVRQRLRDLAPHVPGTVARAVERALAVDPARRFPSAHEMARVIGHLKAGLREWARSDHDNHLRCWSARANAAGHAALQLCTSDAGGGNVAVDVTKLPSGQHVRALCATVPARTLNVYLRHCFDEIAKI